MTQHNNRSVQSLPSERPPQYTESPTQSLSGSMFDPTAALDDFSALRISNPVYDAISTNADPISRTGSSLSTRSMQNIPHVPRPGYAATLPHAHVLHPIDGPVGDGTFSYPAESRGTQRSSFNDHEYMSMHSYEEPTDGYGSPDSLGYPSTQSQAYSLSSWQPRGDYNPLYAAASNVLGMGPPPSSSSSLAPLPPIHHASQTSLNSSHSSSSVLYSQQSPDTGEFETRPSLQRTGTLASVKLTSHKSKAIDLSAPPYTKEYIDQYRQRIKADPDPEAHFLYAKYLIDAAKKIRSTAKDRRAAKKYSEVLIGESLKVIRRLATQGEAYDDAQFFLANCYGTGALGLQVDHERAYHLYLQAAKQNHAAASYRVAVCNEIGAGTRREPPRAAAFYRKAASLGDTPAMYKLGMILLNGLLGEPKNPREAINWLKRAAEQADEENPHALHELGLLHEIPNSPLVPYDPAYAKSLFTQAAQLGYTPSQYKLGQCYEYGSLTCAVDPRRSIAWYTKAAEKGDSEAELALSGWYLTGSEGVLKQSDSEAYLWARRAANKGLSKAEYAVGYYAEVGIGIKQDIEFAKRWYMRAAGMLVFYCHRYVD